jgi:hypothetical protein
MPSFGGEVKHLAHVPALGHVKEPSYFVNLLDKFLNIVRSFASRECCLPAWYAVPLEMNEGDSFRGKGTISLYGFSVE